ncbi:MAG: choice-of-anchor P family protein [Actinomycetota bacterium]
MFLPLSLAQADGTEGLGIPVGVSIASGTGMVTAGTGLAVQPADINVAVPAAASVQQVLLYWEGLHHESGPGDNTVEVNGNPVTGDLIGGPTLFFSQTASSSFRADITTLAAVVPGNNVLSISGLVNSGDFATSDGASVVVIFDDGSAPANLQIRDGNDVAFANFSPPIDTTVAQTFNFPASVQDRTADLTLMVGNVEQDRPNSIKITVGGTTTTLADQLASNQGSDWDNLLLPVLVPAGETSLTVQVLSAPDGSGRLPASLIWVAATLSLSAPVDNVDLSVTKTDSPDPVQVGDELTYTVTVTNNSATDATGVVAEDTLPAGVTFVSAVSTIGSCAEAAGTVTCDIGNLGAGQSAVITIKVTPTAAGEIENTVTVTGTEPDPDPTNNTATTTTTVNPIPMADLSVTKTDSPDPVQVGDELTYTVTVTNNSPTTGATGVVAEDTLPAGVTFVSAVSTIGSCAEAAGTVTCDIGNLGAGQSAVITIKVTPTAAGQIENTVSVTGTEPDPDPTNNTATTTTTVNPACPVPTTPEITHGSAFGLDASVLGLNIVKAGLVSTVAPGSPAAAARRSITINVPLVLAATINENQSASSLTPAPNSKASSTISNVSLLSGLVTATSIRGVSQSVASQTSASYNSTGSEIQGLKVNNVPVSVSPNQKVLVKDPLIPTRVIAELHIYQESGTSTFAGSLSQASHSVNMLRLVLLKSFLGLPTGAEIIVAHAQSDAQGPAVNCPDAQSVSGEAFTALVQGKFNGNVIAETKIGEALLPPTGGSDSDGTTASIPGVVTNSTTTNTTSGSLSPNPNATARSVIQGLNLFAGLVTATAVDVSSTSSANGLTAGTQFAATFVNLKVGSTTVSANVAPNSVISLSLPGGGFLVVIINERTVGGNGTTDTEGTINAIHAFAFTPGGLLESEVIVASAHSDAHS